MWYTCTACAFATNSRSQKIKHQQETGHTINAEEDDE